MGGPHKLPPLTFRPGTRPGDPDGDRAWLQRHAEATGQKPGTIIARALAEYRARMEGAAPGDGAAQAR